MSDIIRFCPQCGEEFYSTFNYCPFDGDKLDTIPDHNQEHPENPAYGVQDRETWYGLDMVPDIEDGRG